MSLFQNNDNRPQTRYNELRTSEAVLGTPLPILIGQQRISWKLLWYGAFTSAQAKQQGGSGGGKGVTSYVYSASVAGALCMGPCVNFLGVWDGVGKFGIESQSLAATLPSSGSIIFTPPNGTQYKQDLGVALLVPYSHTANDYGSPGAIALTGTQQGPLVYTPSPTPGPGEYTVVGTPSIGPFQITSIDAAVGGNTTYNGVVTGGAANAFAGYVFVMETASTLYPQNVGQFTCVASTATSVTLNNPNGVAAASVVFQAAVLAGAPVYVFNAAQAGAQIVVNIAYLRYLIQANENDIAAGTVIVEYQAQYNFDSGVTYYPSGVALTPVAGTPTVTGTYNPNGGGPLGTSNSPSGGVYLFAPGDWGQAVTIDYAYNDPNIDDNTTNYQNLTFFGGSLGQAPWSYLTSSFPSDALGYSEVCYMASIALYLGFSNLLPQLNFEILGPYSFGGGVPDANPADAIFGLLTNPSYKYNFPAANIDTSLLGIYAVTGAVSSGTFTSGEVVKQTTTGATANLIGTVTGSNPMQTTLIVGTANGTSTWVGQTSGAIYTPTDSPTSSSARAQWSTNDFFISDILDSQTSLMDTISRWCEAGQVYISWDEGLLKFIPLCDTTTVGNGIIYSPPTQPVIDLDDSDFVPEEKDKDPITIAQTPWQNRWNRVNVRWSVRTNDYNEDILQVQDEASVQQYGLMSESAQDYQFICTEDAAQYAAAMRLQRLSAIYTTYNFTLKSNFAFVSPGDVVTVTDGLLGTSGTMFGRTPVRLTKVTDDPTKGIVCEAENFPWSVGAAVLNNVQAQNPSNTNDGPQEYPGNTIPAIFEVPNQAAQWNGGTIYIFANGSNVNWGGFELYVSFNGVDYTYYGKYSTPGRIGVTANDFPGGSGSAPENTAKLYVFQPPAGGSSSLATIYANADGAVVAIPWSADNVSPTLGGWETSSGSASAGYNFTDFDAVINTQIGYGATSVVVLLEPVSFEPANGYTPNYVFTTGYATSISSPTGQLYTAASTFYPGSGAIPVNTCAQGVDNTAFPAAFQAPFVTAWKAAVVAALNHMKAASYASKIAYVRVGCSTGGQSNPVSVAALETICSPATFAGLQTAWLAYVNAVEVAIVGTASGFLFDQAISGGMFSGVNAIPYSFADAMAAQAVANGFGVGGQGLQNYDITAFGTYGTISGGSATSGYPSADFCYVWATYPGSLHESQTVAASNPAFVGTPSQGVMGSLVPLVPFAVARGTNRMELYYADWQVAFDSSSPYYSSYSAAYQATFAAARAGSTGSGTPYPQNYLDNTNTLIVNMQQSGATLQSVTAADRDALVTLSAIVSPGQAFTQQNTATVGQSVGTSASGASVGSAGPNVALTAQDVDYSSPRAIWSNVNGVLGSSSYASVVLNCPGPYAVNSDLLVALTNFDVPSPGIGPIVGVAVSFKAYYTQSSGPTSTPGLAVAIAEGENYFLAGTQVQSLTTTPTTYTLGGASDLWDFPAGNLYAIDGILNGLGFTLEGINNVVGSDVTVYVQDVLVTIYWNAAGAAIQWSSPSCITGTSCDASVSFTSSDVSQWLAATNFGFSLPFGFVLDGIVVTVTGKMNSAPGTITAQLMYQGLRIGSAKSLVLGTGGGFGLAYTFGTATDIWSAEQTLDLDALNDPSFGVAFQCSGDFGDDAFLQNAQITLNGTSTTNLELISYETATLIGLNTYALTSMRRGVDGSYPCDHPPGSVFVRLDQATLTYTIPSNFIGESLFFKFLSFNAYGNQLQSLANVQAYEVEIGSLSPGAIDAATGALLTGTPNWDVSLIESAISALYGSYGIDNIPPGYALMGNPLLGVSGIPQWVPLAGGPNQGAAPGVNDMYIYIPPIAGTYGPAQELYFSQPVRNVIFPSGMTSSNSGCRVAPTGNIVVSLNKNGIQFGTVNIAAGATTATFTVSSSVMFNGLTDTFSITAPVTVDKTFAGFWLDIYATRNN
jgi:hypothetical protein